MVFTYLINKGFVMNLPIVHSLLWSEIFSYFRQTAIQMEAPTRDSFNNTFIPKEARTAANSSFIFARSGSQIPGILLEGIALDIVHSTPIFTAGGAKVIYELILFKKYSCFST
jgi:hypothetical protein